MCIKKKARSRWEVDTVQKTVTYLPVTLRTLLLISPKFVCCFLWSLKDCHVGLSFWWFGTFCSPPKVSFWATCQRFWPSFSFGKNIAANIASKLYFNLLTIVKANCDSGLPAVTECFVLPLCLFQHNPSVEILLCFAVQQLLDGLIQPLGSVPALWYQAWMLSICQRLMGRIFSD